MRTRKKILLESSLFLILVFTVFYFRSVDKQSGGQNASASGYLKNYQYRWMRFPTALDKDSELDRLRDFAKTASEHGFNGIALSHNIDMIDIWEKSIPNYIWRLQEAKKICESYNLEMIPTLFGLGRAIIRHDLYLAEGLPVNNALAVVSGGKAYWQQDPAPIFVNPGFEDCEPNKTCAGYRFHDQPGKISFLDTEIFHGGKASLRFENFATYDPYGQARLLQENIAVQPHRAYRITAWLRTENLAPRDTFRFFVRPTVENRTLVIHNPFYGIAWPGNTAASGEPWIKVTAGFNSLEYDHVNVYIGVWNGTGGKFWLDDISMEEVGPINILRREGTPITVKSESSDAVYEEGKDFARIEDSDLANSRGDADLHFRFAHEVEPLELLPGTRIKDGERLRVSWYHGMVVSEANGVPICMSEPKVYEIWETVVKKIDEVIAPQKYFSLIDEVRGGGSCEADKKRNMSVAQILGYTLVKQREIVKKINPQAQFFVYSDMFDPYHNAHDKYYAVDGDFTGSWNYIPKDVVIVNWNSAKKKESLNHFSTLGLKSIIWGYYDADNLDGEKLWLDAARSMPDVVGFSYTSYQNKYDLLAPYGDLMAQELDKGPISDLVGYWKFENNLNDSSENNYALNNGNISGNYFWEEGKKGKSFSFDGYSYIKVPNAIVLDHSQKLSVAFWVYPALLDGKIRGLISKRIDNNNEQSYDIYFGDGNKIYFDIDKNDNRFATNTVFKQNEWYHVAVIYDGTLPENERVKAYVNGHLDKTASETSTSIPHYVSNLYMGTMNENLSAGALFKGKMGEVIIKRAAMNLAEITSLVEGNHAPIAPEQTFATNKNVAATIQLFATDADNDTLSYFIVSQPAHGKLTGTGANLIYTPDNNYSGSDKFNYKANDGSIDSDIAAVSISIVGSSVNQRPQVNAGADQTAAINQSINLSGTVSDDNLPNPPGKLTLLWQKVSGPGTVNFSNNSAQNTSVNFSQTGAYVLRLIADDGGLTATDEINVTVANQSTDMGISSLIPLSGTVGTQVSVNGNNFGSAKGFVFFGSISAEIISWAHTKIMAKVPNNLGIGNVKVTVKRGEVLSNSMEFIILSSETDLTPPNAPGSLKITPEEDELAITWKNPADNDFDRVKVIRKKGVAPLSKDDGEPVYEGTDQKYIDRIVRGTDLYYYAVFALDQNGNYSKMASVSGKLKAVKGGQAEKKMQPAASLDSMAQEAKDVCGATQFVPLDEEGKKIYLDLIKLNKQKITQNEKYALAAFIHYGTKSTKILGKGERAGVVKSYFEAFSKLPKTESQWQDAIKIANGRWPKQTNKTRETKMKKIFKSIYNREPNLKNQNDSAAVSIIAYGLRPAARNLESERRAVASYKWILGHNPASVGDWDVVRAIAYSGAKR